MISNLFMFISSELILFITALALGGLATFVNSRMVIDVNRKLPESEQFSHFFWYPKKHRKLFSEHCRLYPRSHLRLIWISAIVAMFSVGIAIAVVSSPLD